MYKIPFNLEMTLSIHCQCQQKLFHLSIYFFIYSADESPAYRPDKVEQLRAGLRRTYEQSLHSNKSEKGKRKRAKDMCLKLCKAAREHAFGTVVSLLGRQNQPLHRYVFGIS